MPSETFTGSQHVAMLVYRNGGINLSSGSAVTGTLMNSSAVLGFTGITLTTLSGANWVCAVAIHQTATDLATPPAGMVNRLTIPSPMIATHDTNGGRTSNWPTTNVPVNASSNWVATVIEVPAVTAFVGSSAANGPVVNYPPGTRVGDLCIAVSLKLNSGESIGGAVGWTGITSGGDGGGRGINIQSRLSPVNGFVPQISHLVPT